MRKIKMSDSVQDIVLKLSVGNPGALTTCFEIIKAKNNDIVQSFPIFLTLDNMKLYGSYLYMLWNDCCGRNIEDVFDVIDGFKTGKITEKDINERIKNVGYGKSFKDLLEEK